MRRSAERRHHFVRVDRIVRDGGACRPYEHGARPRGLIPLSSPPFNLSPSLPVAPFVQYGLPYWFHAESGKSIWEPPNGNDVGNEEEGDGDDNSDGDNGSSDGHHGTCDAKERLSDIYARRPPPRY